MKFSSIFTLLFLLFVSCQKEEQPYDDAADKDVTHQDVIGNLYQNSLYTIDILSEDSLYWKLRVNRDSTFTYLLPYNFNNNKISFFIEDSVITNFISPITGVEEFTVSQYFDTFKGSFNGEDMLVGDTVVHRYEKYYSVNRIPTSYKVFESKGVSIPKILGEF